jgi:hypothetical protein
MTPMSDNDVQLEETAVEVFSPPLCDDEDEPVTHAQEVAHADSSDDDVEAHGGVGGFNDRA